MAGATMQFELVLVVSESPMRLVRTHAAAASAHSGMCAQTTGGRSDATETTVLVVLE
jgi:hypothetical protein